MKTGNIKRRLLIGLLVAGIAAAGGQAVRSYTKETVVSDDPLVRELQVLYPNVEADHIRLGALEQVPDAEKPLTPAEREQRTTAIEHEIKQLSNQKAPYLSAMGDMNKSIAAVEADFAKGVLSQKDKEMLLRMFQDKQDGYRKVVTDVDARIGDLDKQKQQLANFQEPDRILYGQAEIDTGSTLVTRSVFFNATQQRMLTEEEIAANPQAASIAHTIPYSEADRRTEYPLLAGSAASILLLALLWRRIGKTSGKRVATPVFLRQET